MNQDLLEPILRSPLLPQLVEELSEKIQKEAEARKNFLQEITPEMKAEFILGEVCMHSPAKAKHLEITGNLFAAFHHYSKPAGNGCVFAEKCLISLTRNDFEPDIVWFSESKATNFTPDQMQFPAPDLAVEVLSKSTKHRDRGIKFEDYALHGIGEYWIVCPDQNTIEQFRLNENEQRYDLHEKLAHGTIRSLVLDGFEMDLADIF